MASLNKSTFFRSFLSYLPIILLFFSVFNEFDFNYLKLDYFSFNFIFILIFFWTLRNPDYLGYFSIFLAACNVFKASLKLFSVLKISAKNIYELIFEGYFLIDKRNKFFAIFRLLISLLNLSLIHI